MSQSNAQAVALIDRWPEWRRARCRARRSRGLRQEPSRQCLAVALATHASRKPTASRPTRCRILRPNAALAVEDIDKGPDRRARAVPPAQSRSRAEDLRAHDIGDAARRSCHRAARFSSRLRALPLAEIEAPDDALLSAVLVKHFADRQLNVEPSVIAYCLRAHGAVDGGGAPAGRRDRRLALAMQRGVTRALAAKALDRIGGSSTDRIKLPGRQPAWTIS